MERLIESEATEMSLTSALGSLWTELVDAVQDGQSSGAVAAVQSKIDDTSTALERIRKTCAQMKRELSLHGDGAIAKYNQIRKDGFILMRMNLKVLRDQILTKLRARRFELASIDRAYRSRALGNVLTISCMSHEADCCLTDRQAQDHAEKAINRRQSGVPALVKKYNAKRDEMLALQKKSQRLAHAYIPPEIQMAGLYQMDVDSDIWSSLEWAEDFCEGNVPKWLSDINVRRGIRFVQEFQNAEREMVRCDLEYKNLRDWFRAECEAASHALCQINDGEFRGV